MHVIVHNPSAAKHSSIVQQISNLASTHGWKRFAFQKSIARIVSYIHEVALVRLVEHSRTTKYNDRTRAEKMQENRAQEEHFL